MNQQQHTQLLLKSEGFATGNELDIATEKLYDRQDLLQMLHISVRTLQYWRSKGLLPYHKIRNKIYYRQTDVEKLLLQNKVIKRQTGH